MSKAEELADEWNSAVTSGFCLAVGNAMAAELRRLAAVEAELASIRALEPVAHLWQHGETGRTRVVMPAMITDMVTDADASWQLVGPLYAIPKEQGCS